MSDLDPIRGRETFVGRRRELDEIRAGIDGAIAGRGSLFTLSGEPGVGKSRLAQEAASHARAQGARVIWGRCWEHGGAPPYWPWVQVLRGLTRGVEPVQFANWMGPGAAEIAQIAPELRNQIGGVPELPGASLGQPEKARFRLFDFPDRPFWQCRRGSASADHSGRPARCGSDVPADAGRIFAASPRHARDCDRDVSGARSETCARARRADRPGGA